MGKSSTEKSVLKNAIVALKKSPLFWISAGSLELSHSNFIAWLIGCYPATASFFGVNSSDEIRVDREKNRIDLTLTCNGRKIFIENKFKSLPDEKQLEKYKTARNKKPRNAGEYRFILLTLIKADSWIDKSGWEQKTYEDLVGFLRKWLSCNQTKTCPRDKEIIQSYCEMVEKVCKIVSHYKKSEKYWFDETNIQKLEEIRFADTIKKLHASRLKSDIRKKISDTQDKNINVKVKSYFHRKQACVDIQIVSNENTELKLIVQIQGNQYRRLVSFTNYNIAKANTNERKAKDYILDFVNDTDKFQWLFSEDFKPKKSIKVKNWGKRYDTSAQKILNSYSPHAIYQYIDIEKHGKENSLKISKLLDCIVNDIELAKTLLGDTEYLERFPSKKA